MSMMVQAINNLRPMALWNLDGNTYEGLDWQDTNQTKPTEEEVNTEIARIQADYEAKEYQRKRALEYPDFKDYLDGVVKSDQQQIQKYIDDCLAVKAKYPKP